MTAPTYKPDHILTLRVTPALRARLAAVLSKVPTGAARLSRHGLAVWCLERGLLEAEAAPRDVLTPPAAPTRPVPATRASAAPSAPVEAQDGRQLPLLVGDRPVVLHTTPGGASVATRVGNDTTPARGRKPTTKRPPDAGIVGDPAESEALRARWRASGASQRGCADATGVGQSTVSRWLSGEKTGSPDTLRTVAAYLDGLTDSPPSTG